MLCDWESCSKRAWTVSRLRVAHHVTKQPESGMSMRSTYFGMCRKNGDSSTYSFDVSDEFLAAEPTLHELGELILALNVKVHR